MRESKSELMDRLRREGQWEAFKKRREELKAGGMEAKPAWVEAAAEFPSPSQVSIEVAPLVDLSPLRGKPAVPIVDVIKWVMANLDVVGVMPAEAPSAGAWSMLYWARSSLSARGEFYRSFVVKLLPKGADQESPKSGVEADEDEEQRAYMLGLLGVEEGQRINEPDGLS